MADDDPRYRQMPAFQLQQIQGHADEFRHAARMQNGQQLDVCRDSLISLDQGIGRAGWHFVVDLDSTLPAAYLGVLLERTLGADWVLDLGDTPLVDVGGCVVVDPTKLITDKLNDPIEYSLVDAYDMLAVVARWRCIPW